jgi:hypothetical protein
MSYLTVEKLSRLAWYLENKVPPENFDMNYWARVISKRSRLGDCGTVACALGWATTIPEFKSEGLRLCNLGKIKHVTFCSEIDYYAAQRFFGITIYQSNFIFSPGYYHRSTIDVHQVIKRINIVKNDIIQDTYIVANEKGNEYAC